MLIVRWQVYNQIHISFDYICLFRMKLSNRYFDYFLFENKTFF